MIYCPYLRHNKLANKKLFFSVYSYNWWNFYLAQKDWFLQRSKHYIFSMLPTYMTCTFALNRSCSYVLEYTLSISNNAFTHSRCFSQIFNHMPHSLKAIISYKTIVHQTFRHSLSLSRSFFRTFVLYNSIFAKNIRLFNWRWDINFFY